MTWFYIFIIIFVILFFSSENKRYKFLFSILLMVYIGVELKLNDNVREASHHGNTKHGWYSKENATEKFLAKAWIFGYPIGLLILTGLILGKIDEEKENFINAKGKNKDKKY